MQDVPKWGQTFHPVGKLLKLIKQTTWSYQEVPETKQAYSILPLQVYI